MARTKTFVDTSAAFMISLGKDLKRASMRKILLILSLAVFSYAVDYSEMSTQELIAIMGFVAPENQKAFEKELAERVKSMTPEEKKRYEENLQKSKEKQNSR